MITLLLQHNGNNQMYLHKGGMNLIDDVNSGGSQTVLGVCGFMGQESMKKM